MIPLIDGGLERYAEDHSSEEPELLRELAEETRQLPGAQMLTGRLEGQLLRLLALMVGAKRVLEIGMFTGYSALCMASALPEDGELITCDVDPEVEAIARRYFQRSPDGKKIHIRMGPALETIASLEGHFDMAFVDADKESYPAYYEALVDRIRPGGLLVVDNVLWSGRVLSPDEDDKDTHAIDRLNGMIQSDSRWDNVLLTVRDGIHVARRRG